jgi:hypothetical protein
MRWGIATVFGFSVACGGSAASPGPDGGTPDASTACVPNQSIACVGPAGCAGGQACNAAGTGYSPCDCGNPHDAGGDVGADSPSSDSGGDDAGSDAAQDAPQDAGPLSPDQIPGLSLWLDSSKGTTPDSMYPNLVQIWADQSPHGNNATDQGYQEEPLLMKSGYKSFDVVDFNASSSPKIMNITDDASLQFGTGDFAVAFVMNAQTLPTIPIYEKDQQNGLTISVDQNVNAITPTAAAHAFMMQNAWHIVVVRGAALEIRIDGTPTKGTLNTSNLSASGVLLQVGAFASSNQSPTIEFLQVIAYKGTVSDTQVVGLESYLKGKYGL